MDTQASDNGSAKFNKDDEAEKILKQGHLGTKNILSVKMVLKDYLKLLRMISS